MTSCSPALSVAQVQAAVRTILSDDRFRHSLGVLETVLEIGLAWNGDPLNEDLVARAALLHDIGKCMGAREVEEARRNGWISTGVELLDTPSLVHAPLSAAYARHRFGLHDAQALLAIAYHPTGHPDFESLGFALFLADYLEPTRAFDNNRENLLSLAKRRPYQAALEILEEKFRYVRRKGREVHPVALAFEQTLRRNLNRGL